MDEQDDSMNACDAPLLELHLKISNIWYENKKLQAENKRLKELLKQAKCPNCDGSGAIPHQVSSRQFVTRDMALDAGDPALEGSLYSDDEWEAEQCQWCYEKDQALAGDNQ